MANYGQNPHTIVVACADSRVPVEHIFSSEVGEIFVVRVAGNVLDKAGLASIEYAAANFDVDQLIVLGHSKCGAVTAAIQRKYEGASMPTEALTSLTDMISLQEGKNLEETIEASIAANARAVARQAQMHLAGLPPKNPKMAFMAAVYDIADGGVVFLN